MDLKLLVALLGLLTLGGCGDSGGGEADAGTGLAPACDPGDPPCDTPTEEVSGGWLTTTCQAEGWRTQESFDGVVIAVLDGDNGYRCWPGKRVACSQPRGKVAVCWDRDGQPADCEVVWPELDVETNALRGDAGAP